MNVDIMLLSFISYHGHDSKQMNTKPSIPLPSPGHDFESCSVGVTTFEVVLKHYREDCGMILMDSTVKAL